MNVKEIEEKIARLTARLRSGEACDLEEHRLGQHIRRLRGELEKAKKREATS